MVSIRPFAALRYNPLRIPDLSPVIAPPYDVISPQEQEELYKASEYNVVRLILGKQHSTDTEQNNRYTRAFQDFTTWRSKSILVKDPKPALYLLEHTFETGQTWRTRLGFIALLEFSGDAEPGVLRHEATLSAPKADRTKLMEAVPANLSSIFCIYPDENGTIQAILETLSRTLPAQATALLRKKEQIRMWAITEADLIDQIKAKLSTVSVLIADGHHRFEVAKGNRKRYGAVMSYFASMADPALLVQPIHRVIEPDRPLNPAVLEELCVVESGTEVNSLLEWLKEESSQAGSRFGFFDGSQLYRLSVRQDKLSEWLMYPSVPLALAGLDVTVLHQWLLPHLGLERCPVQYTPDAHEALAIAAKSRCAWILRGIPLPSIYAIASQGLTLAPKSTYFYPKVPSGVTFNAFD
ncbi:MAG: DUF1015 domain-containing protein [Candidatus Omnitrophica bacterium]|nr:DUF1015 domain-containing protein [Candidatus Omnitrophota bacterium]